MKLRFVIYGNEIEKNMIINILDEKGLKYQINKVDTKNLDVEINVEIGIVWFSAITDEALNQINEKLAGTRML